MKEGVWEGDGMRLTHFSKPESWITSSKRLVPIIRNVRGVRKG